MVLISAGAGVFDYEVPALLYDSYTDVIAAVDVPSPDEMSGDTQAVYSGGYGSTSSVNNREASSDTNYLIQTSGRATPVMNGHHGTGDGSYEELLKDSVPCPTCRGLGRVPRDQEGELVALIPMKDKRLKPRRTVLYVAVAIMLCLLMAGLCMFFLFPRDVVITSNRPRLEPRTLHLNISATFVNFTIMNFYNFTNNNFYPVKILGAQMTAMYDQHVMVTAANHTEVTVPIKSVVSYGILMTIVLSKNNDFEFLVKFCEDSRPWVHNLPITFEMLANYTYLGHGEQASLTTYQQVSCYNSSSYKAN